jgi:delta 1-pyrroline-5-carboxylate dehydrogenase
MIGAVIGVQPFGGEGLSSTGPKPGGPRYLHRFATERTTSIDTTAASGNACRRRRRRRLWVQAVRKLARSICS